MNWKGTERKGLFEIWGLTKNFHGLREEGNENLDNSDFGKN